MDEKIAKLKEFILKYGFDYLDDGTKDKIINKIDSGDEAFILEILQAIDKDWIERTKEIGKFGIFTDNEYQDANGNKITKPYMKANYIDSCDPNQNHIPVLRRVEPRFKTWHVCLRDFEI